MKSWSWLWRVLVDWLIIVVAFVAVSEWWWLFWPASIVIGNRQHALGIMGHDASHYTIFGGRKTGDFAANLLIYWLFGGCMERGRKYHFMHHRKVGTADDPELIYLTRFNSLPITRRRIVLGVLIDLLGFGTPSSIKFYRAGFLPPDPKALVVVLLAIATFLFFGLWWVPLLWFFSFSTALWAVYILRSVTEHVGTKGVHRISLSWWQKHLFAPHFTSYHWEHHEHPSVPCWELPGLREPSAQTETLWSLMRRLERTYECERG